MRSQIPGPTKAKKRTTATHLLVALGVPTSANGTTQIARPMPMITPTTTRPMSPATRPTHMRPHACRLAADPETGFPDMSEATTWWTVR